MKLPSLFSKKKKQSVNLLPKDTFESSLLGQVLEWALVFGKWTVILTQLVVVSAFLMRFGLDRRLHNVRDEIDKNVTIINSYAELEKEFNVTQRRVNYTKPLVEQQKNVLIVFDVLGEITPIDVWYDKISFTANSVSLDAYAGSIYGFNSFLVATQRDPFIRRVNINSLQSSTTTDSLLEFQVSLGYGDQPR